MRLAPSIARITMAISKDERAFFIELGSRIRALRKTQGITQVQLSEVLGISQQAMNSFEKGRRRVPVSALSTIAHALGVSLDELLDEESRAEKTAPKKRGPAPKIQQQLERLSALPKAQQRAVMMMLDSMIALGSR